MSEPSDLARGPQSEALHSRPATPVLEQMLVSVANVAAALSVSTTTVRELTHQGDLLCVSIGRRMLYRPEDVKSFVESLTEN